jgi:hypothetical protein
MRRSCVSQARVVATRGLAVVCAALGCAARTQDADPALADLIPEDRQPLVRFWEPGLSVGLGGGYKDNVGLSHAAPDASAFFRSSVEASLFRLPLDGTQLSLFLSAEDTRYFSSATTDNEVAAFAQGEARRFLGRGWEVALGVEGSYLDQVIDLSVTETNREAVLVRGAGVTVRPGARREWAGGWWAALELPAVRQWYEETIDDYWQVGPRLVAGRTYGRKSELALSYEFTRREYDQDLARDAAGVEITNQVRAAGQHDVTLAWKHHWDERQRWRTVTKLSGRVSHDNGGGYFDYRRIQVSEQVRFRTPRWLFSAEARLGFYHYPVQTVAPGDPELRERADLAFTVRGEYQVATHFRLFAQFDREQALSNLTLDEYTANSVSGGLLLEF